MVAWRPWGVLKMSTRFERVLREGSLGPRCRSFAITLVSHPLCQDLTTPVLVATASGPCQSSRDGPQPLLFGVATLRSSALLFFVVYSLDKTESYADSEAEWSEVNSNALFVKFDYFFRR